MTTKMSENIKYIRNKHTFIAFNKNFIHSDMASFIFGKDVLIHGAGFVNFEKDKSGIKVQCHGKSVSLRVSPRLDDADCIVDILGINKPAKFIISSNKLLIFSDQLEQNELAAKVFNENQKYFTGLFSLTQKSGRVKGVCTDFEGNISKEITEHFNSLFCV